MTKFRIPKISTNKNLWFQKWKNFFHFPLVLQISVIVKTIFLKTKFCKTNFGIYFRYIFVLHKNEIYIFVTIPLSKHICIFYSMGTIAASPSLPPYLKAICNNIPGHTVGRSKAAGTGAGLGNILPLAFFPPTTRTTAKGKRNQNYQICLPPFP